MLDALIERDRNHPSVVMWSLANEAHTQQNGARPYFKELIDRAHFLDPTRPVDIVFNSDFNQDQVVSKNVHTI